MIYLKIYIIISIIFGLNAILQQYFRYPLKSGKWKLLFVFLINTIGFPICLIIALFHKTLIPWNLINALKEQGPFKRFFRNFFITGNAWGMFHKNAHYRGDNGKEKVGFSKKSAIKAAASMSKKHDKHFSIYRCIFCGKYHVGKNRDNK